MSRFNFAFIGAGSSVFTMRLVGDILTEDFINRHKKPRTIPSKLPRRLPEGVYNNTFYEASSDNFIEYCGVVSVTCKNSEFVFEYADADIGFLDN